MIPRLIVIEKDGYTLKKCDGCGVVRITKGDTERTVLANGRPLNEETAYDFIRAVFRPQGR